MNTNILESLMNYKIVFETVETCPEFFSESWLEGLISWKLIGSWTRIKLFIFETILVNFSPESYFSSIWSV